MVKMINLSSGFIEKNTSYVWLLKCCKNQIFYDMKIYFHSIKINLYSIKYILIMPSFLPWYQNLFLLNQNKFLFSKKHFYHTSLFIQAKLFFFFYLNFPFNTFLLNISDTPFVITKIRISLSACNLNNSTSKRKSY